MALILLSAIPCSRVDLMPCRNDGWGGWVYSQADPCRCYTKFDDDCYLFLAMSIFAPAVAASEDDFVERTTLIVVQGETEIGRSELEWKTNNWGIHLNEGSVYSWPQRVGILPEDDGLVEIRILLKLRSQPEPIEVTQRAYCHIRQEDRDASQLSPLRYLFARFRNRLRTFR